MIQMVKYLQRLLEGPIVGHLGTRDENHHVCRTIFFSAAVLENPPRLVLHIPEVGLASVRRNLLISNYVAALFNDAVTYQSVQVKGSAAIRLVTDLEESYFEMMRQRLADIHYPDRLFTMQHKPLIALEIIIMEIYNQTPGTGAGELLVFE
jgi:hypothetical protein